MALRGIRGRGNDRGLLASRGRGCGSLGDSGSGIGRRAHGGGSDGCGIVGGSCNGRCGRRLNNRSIRAGALYSSSSNGSGGGGVGMDGGCDHRGCLSGRRGNRGAGDGRSLAWGGSHSGGSYSSSLARIRRNCLSHNLGSVGRVSLNCRGDAGGIVLRVER